MSGGREGILLLIIIETTEKYVIGTELSYTISPSLVNGNKPKRLCI